MKKTISTILLLLAIGLQSGSCQENLNIMTFNVRYDELFYEPGNTSSNNCANRKDFQASLLNFHQPDVIGMQEPLGHQVHFFDKALPGYKWVGVAREDGKNEGEYNPIFYKRHKMEVLSSGTFWLSKTSEIASKSWDSGYKRICTWALFRGKGSGAKFYVFNTHFDSKGKKARLESAKLISKKISALDKNIPVFVTGDFNFLPDSSAYYEITANGLFDGKKVSEKEPYGPKGTFNGFKFDRTPEYRIDFIFVNKRIKVLRYGVLTDSHNQKYPSDHFPVSLFVELTE
jgi:endonuclease/exonuclease/phosphatase family metal-dependent hydrolase